MMAALLMADDLFEVEKSQREAREQAGAGGPRPEAGAADRPAGLDNRQVP
jgi:hypothetical protein